MGSNLEDGRRDEPLKMSFCPRGRTLVRGWRRDLTSLIDESGDVATGIDLPPNLTVILMFVSVSES